MVEAIASASGGKVKLWKLDNTLLNTLVCKDEGGGNCHPISDSKMIASATKTNRQTLTAG